MFKFAGIIFCALVFLAGCSTTPPPPPEWSADNSITNSAANFISTPSVVQTNKSGASGAQTNFSPLAHLNVPPPSITNSAPVTTWTSLANWAAERKIGKLHRLSQSPVTSYAIGSSNGVMVLGIGSLGATWNGIEINLGFAPQLIDGEVSLFGLDLKKNLEPLLCEPPLTFRDKPRHRD